MDSAPVPIHSSAPVGEPSEDAHRSDLDWEERQSRRAVPGWALGGGLIGIIGGVVGALLCVGAEAGRADFAMGLGFGIPALVVGAITIPLAALGAGSARSTGAKGVVPLRVFGWILYGAMLIEGIILVALAGNEFPPMLVMSAGLVGLLAAVFMSIDAFVGRGQAARIAAGERVERPARVLIAPMLALGAGRGGGVAPTLGVRGSF